jgi:hypothetical protein
MQLRDTMLAQLAIARRIVKDGHQVVPAWRIGCADGDWIVLTRFDHDAPGQRDRAVTLVKRFMAWKLAQSFILTTETWLGPVETRAGEEAIATVGASRTERLGVLQVIRRGIGGVQFGPPLWLSPDQCDPEYWTLLPSRAESITAAELRSLAVLFAENGEFQTQKA